MQSAIPRRLRDLMSGSAMAGEVLSFVERCDQILADNKMAFFPAFTDHGTAHVGSVLKAAEMLIPDSVWDDELLTADDAAALIAACFLHDLGLHITEAGFVGLVAQGTRFEPLPWFATDQRGRQHDLPWPELWEEYQREAARFSQSQLDRILGPDHGDTPRIAPGEFPDDPSDWGLNDRLLIGEFLRRHHARLGHEIVLFGFPGAPENDFPPLATLVPRLADPVGAIARSHNEDLRLAAEYLDGRSPGDLRPDGIAQLYLMGILRVADYFQLESSRATPLLLHLRDPQSPVSLAEWHRHQAIVSISSDHRDPDAISVQVGTDHNLRTHLQLRELLESLQMELDLTAAVLGEAYGGGKLSALQLGRRRVRSNIDDPALHARLSFIPRASYLRSAEDLFRLMIGDLYGNQPAVAGRELLQNAVDAVRERRRWEDATERQVDRAGFGPEAADVTVEIREVDKEHSVLRVIDHGIGMTPETVDESFLTAGATFGPAAGEVDLAPRSDVTLPKAGRFGIGVFAAFMLGDEIQVTTRHLGESRGLTFIARPDDGLVQLEWSDDAPFGTEIVVPHQPQHRPASAKRLDGDQFSSRRLLNEIARYFTLSDPHVEFIVVSRDGSQDRLARQGEVPKWTGRIPDHWRKVHSDDFDSILWAIPAPEYRTVDVFAPPAGLGANFAHNGFLISKPRRTEDDEAYQWSVESYAELLHTPSLAVFDSQQRLRITLNRYELATPELPFEVNLLDSIGVDVVAHALACGMASHPLGQTWGLRPVVSRTGWMPFLPQLLDEYATGPLCILISPAPELFGMGSRFLRGQMNTVGWRNLPYRATMPTLDAYADELDEEWIERDSSLLRSHTEKEIRYTMDRAETWTGRFASAGVLLQEDGNIKELAGSRNPEMKKTNDLLSEAANELVGDTLFGYLALIVFKPFIDDELKFDEPLAWAWQETLGGLLDRSPKAREARIENLTTRTSEIVTGVNKWRRMSAAQSAAHRAARRSVGLPATRRPRSQPQ